MGQLPIRMLNEIQYCERLFYLMQVQGLFEESEDTLEGKFQHQRRERTTSKSKFKQPEEIWDSAPQSLQLGSEELGIIGKLDAIQYEDNLWVPIEWKHSSSPSDNKSFNWEGHELSGEAWPNDQIQICAQGLLLRANGFNCEYGYLYYRGNKKKIKIELTDILIQATNICIQKAMSLQKSEDIPKPLLDSNKCFRCSLNYICLPDETNYLTGISCNIRRIIPERQDGGVLYISEPGAKIGRQGEQIVIHFPDQRKEEIPLKDLIHINLMGNIQCSTQLIHTLMASGIGISYLSTHGKYMGSLSPATTKNVLLRKKQFTKLLHPETALRLSQWITYSKISNQRTLLRRNGKATDQTLRKMLQLRDQSLEVQNLDSLRGIEGQAAKLYFHYFPTMLKHVFGDTEAFMKGRNRRPAKDPVNALLSLGYTLLLKDVVSACSSVGLDPLFGFYHRVEPGRPSLALDLMETFRPILVDSTVIRCLNTKEIELHDFYLGEDSCQLKQDRRKQFFTAYERRMHEQITHPTFGYKISYRRILDVEVRMFARYLEGELAEYRPITTR